jgi:hypothetical protein
MHYAERREGRLAMDLKIEIADDIGAALNAQAQAEGLSPDCYVRRMIEMSVGREIKPDNLGQPFETGYGIWAKYGPAPSDEEIDENRREMFRNFARDL